MSRKQFENMLKYNMGEFKKLKTASLTIPFEEQPHHPEADDLPIMDILGTRPSIDDDIEELESLKKLVIDKDETVIPQLVKFRHLPEDKCYTRDEILHDYMFNSNFYSQLKLNYRHDVSYRCGYFYNIQESTATIIDYTTESIPAIFNKDKHLTAAKLKAHNINNSINVISCYKLDPHFVTIHTPK